MSFVLSVFFLISLVSLCVSALAALPLLFCSCETATACTAWVVKVVAQGVSLPHHFALNLPKFDDLLRRLRSVLHHGPSSFIT
jgi:hypothetical protein